jgi:hypothetical protein
LLMVLIGLVERSGKWVVSQNSWYKGLCSPMFCSEMRWLWSLCVWMYSCSCGNDNALLLTCFSKDIISSVGLYSCLLLRMCCACADWVLLYFICLMCSWYLYLSPGLVCPTFAISHVLQLSIYIFHSCLFLVYCWLAFVS